MEKWYVRNTAGKVFGPIDLETLKGWVKDGRVEPLAGVSSDLKNWILAPLKPELEMNWVVENQPGQFYGPTHSAVLKDLVKAGSLSPNARFFQDDRGSTMERVRSLESALAAKDAEVVRGETVLAEAQKLSAKKDLQLAAAQKAIAQRYERISEAVATLAQRDSQIAELAKAVSMKEGERAQARAELAKREADIQSLADELRQRDAEIADLKEQIAKSQEPHAREWSTEVIVPEVVTNELPPPVARQAFGSASGSTAAGNAAMLADLERRAQQELARMGAVRATKFFKVKK